MDLLYSKKFQAALLGVAIMIAKHFTPQLDEISALELTLPILVYIAGQGLADALPGKEKVKMEAIIKSLEHDQNDS